MFKTIANVCVIVHTFGIKVSKTKTHTLLFSVYSKTGIKTNVFCGFITIIYLKIKQYLRQGC